MTDFTLRGVPASIQTDGWWLDAPVFRRPPAGPARAGGKTGPAAVLALLLLIVAADVLIWQVVPGLSLAVFGLIVLCAAALVADARAAGGIVLGAGLMLPVVEQVQALSLAFWILGLATGAGWIGLGGWQGVAATLRAGWRFVQSAPGQLRGDLRLLRQGTPGIPQANLRRMALGWSVPVGLGLVFAALLVEANPMLSRAFDGLGRIEGPQVGRLLFWIGAALLVWPFLRLAVMRERLRLPFAARGAWVAPAILNAASVRRSLVLFNLLFAAQSVSDLTYLWGGASLPDGMSYAEYAHRGAYPLLVTALLAGAFALMARPFVAQDRLLRAVLLIWVAQTVLLVLSSILRLDLFVGAYGLTRLRLAAFVWMGVVAAGLILVIWQVIAGRSAGWLLARAAGLGVVVLYCCSFVSFDRAIAGYNLSHDVPVDRWYICQLGPAALPAIHLYETRTQQRLCPSDQPWVSAPRDWREWGFRNQRTRTSLAAINKGAF
jgi:hypothetical protein